MNWFFISFTVEHFVILDFYLPTYISYPYFNYLNLSLPPSLPLSHTRARALSLLALLVSSSQSSSTLKSSIRSSTSNKVCLCYCAYCLSISSLRVRLILFNPFLHYHRYNPLIIIIITSPLIFIIIFLPFRLKIYPPPYCFLFPYNF